MTPTLDLSDLADRLAAASEDRIDTVVTDALRRLAHDTGADRAYVTLYHDDGTFENLHEWTARDVVPQLPAIQRLASADFHHTHGLVRRGENFVAPDVGALPPVAAAERRSFASFGVQAVLQVPVMVLGDGIGLVGINHYEPVDGWPDEAVEALRRLGQVIGVVLVHARSLGSARRAEEQVARASSEKNQLLAQISHELRTPLHAILGYAELLELEAGDRVDDGVDVDALQQIRFHGRHLSTMIEDLLSLATHADDDLDDVTVGDVLDEAIAGLGSSTETRGIRIASTEAARAVVARSELGRLRQLLYCLLSGAVQTMTAGGSIDIDAAPGDDDQAGDALLVRVRSRTDLGADAPLIPMTRALLRRRWTLATDRHSARSADIRIGFGPATVCGPACA